MFRIGDFSRLAQVSCRLLRYYDEIGLLRPAHVDEATGYRSYAASQLVRLSRILVLRDLGFSLEQIARMVDEALDVEELRSMLRLRKAELEREIAERRSSLDHIELRIADLDDQTVERGDIVVRAEPGFWYASRRSRFGSFDEARAAVQALLRDAGGREPALTLGRLIVIQHAARFEPDDLDLETGFVVAPPEASPGAPEAPEAAELPGELAIGSQTLALRRVPRQERVAAVVRVGPPDAAHQQGMRLAREIEATGHVIDGPNREVFLQNPGPGRPPVVEMQYPIRRR